MDRKLQEVSWLAGCVYFTQGALGIAGVSLPLYLRSLGWSVGEITTVSAVAAFPWVLKILYGLLSDCLPLLGYRRKSYLILFALASSFGWGSLLFFPELKIFIIISLATANLGLAATDVITDGLIVENSEGESSHIFQSIAWGTRSLGAILSGVTGGWLASRWDPKQVFLLTSSLPLLIVILSFFLEEEKRSRGPFHNVAEPLRRSFSFLLHPNFRWFMLLLLISQIASCFGVPFFFHMKEHLGFKETFLGSLMSLGWIGVVIASLFYAKWLRKASPRKVLSWAVILNSINIFSTLLIRDEQTALILVFFGGMLACLTLLPIMSVSAMLTHNSGVEGTLFAVLMSIHNLGQIGFGLLGGKLYPVLGLQAMIIGSGLIGLSGLWVIFRLRFHEGGSPAIPPGEVNDEMGNA